MLTLFCFKNLALHPYPCSQSGPRDILILIIFGKMLAGHNGHISPPDAKTCSVFSQPVSPHPSGSARSPLSSRHGITSHQDCLGIQSQASLGNNGNNPGIPMRKDWCVCMLLPPPLTAALSEGPGLVKPGLARPAAEGGSWGLRRTQGQLPLEWGNCQFPGYYSLFT